MKLRLSTGVAVAVAGVVGMEAVRLLSDWGPGMAATTSAHPGDPTAQHLHAAELAGGAAVLAVAGCIAYLTRSWAPLLMAAVTVGVVIGAHEAVLRS